MSTPLPKPPIVPPAPFSEPPETASSPFTASAVSPSGLHAHESSTCYGYEVQVRLQPGTEPRVIEGEVITDQWRKWPIAADDIPEDFQISGRVARFGLLPTREVAESLRWMLHAFVTAQDFGTSLALESRIATYEIKRTTAVTLVGVLPVQGTTQNPVRHV